MKKLLLLYTVLAGVFTFTGYGEEPAQDAEKVAITGFGGFALGTRLIPEKLSQQTREKGNLRCKAKTQFRNFEKVTLYFTPKTFLIYKIMSTSEGGSGELAIIKASFEKKYAEEMKPFDIGSGYSLSRGDRIVKIERLGWIRIIVSDEKLSKQNDKETKEFAQEQVDTSGL